MSIILIVVKVYFNKDVMRFIYLHFIICCSLLFACDSADPCFPEQKALTPESMPLQGLNSSVRVRIKPPFLILQKRRSHPDSLLCADDRICDKLEKGFGSDIVFNYDSLYVSDAMCAISGIAPHMVDYYADPDMKRVYVNDSRIVFCYGYKKQIDFMDFKYNLINKVKFKFANPAHIDSKNQGDLNLSYLCSYLGKHYFYTLFWGVSSNEYKPGSSRVTYLEVYDLDGNPVVRYRLKGKFPVYFAVDEETFTLYGPETYDDPEDHLLVYELKGLS